MILVPPHWDWDGKQWVFHSAGWAKSGTKEVVYRATPAPGGPDVAANAEAAPAASTQAVEPQASTTTVYVYTGVYVAPLIVYPIWHPLPSGARVSPPALPLLADAPQSALSPSQQPAEPWQQAGPRREHQARDETLAAAEHQALDKAIDATVDQAVPAAEHQAVDQAVPAAEHQALDAAVDQAVPAAEHQALDATFKSKRLDVGQQPQWHPQRRWASWRGQTPLGEQAYLRRTRTPT